MAKRHIKFFRYYKEWIETYKKYQISEREKLRGTNDEDEKS